MHPAAFLPVLRLDRIEDLQHLGLEGGTHRLVWHGAARRIEPEPRAVDVEDVAREHQVQLPGFVALRVARQPGHEVEERLRGKVAPPPDGLSAGVGNDDTLLLLEMQIGDDDEHDRIRSR
jgi:hypothetical protein